MNGVRAYKWLVSLFAVILCAGLLVPAVAFSVEMDSSSPSAASANSVSLVSQNPQVGGEVRSSSEYAIGVDESPVLSHTPGEITYSAEPDQEGSQSDNRFSAIMLVVLILFSAMIVGFCEWSIRRNNR